MKNDLQSKLKKDETGLYYDHDLGRLHFDFLTDKAHYNRSLDKGKNELIAKAIGVGKGYQSVIDATAGMGVDSLTLARFGLKVLALERSEIIWMLLDDAYGRALKDLKWLANLQFKLADSLSYISQLPSEECPDVIYIDPMYPVKKKSALPKKEMRIFRDIVGDDLDSERLFKASINKAKHRVVVKRPLKAEPLILNPNHQFEGNTVRYDLYIANSLQSHK